MCSRLQTPADPSAEAADSHGTTQGRSRRKRARPSYLEAYDDGQVGTLLGVIFLCCMCSLQLHSGAGDCSSGAYKSLLRKKAELPVLCSSLCARALKCLRSLQHACLPRPSQSTCMMSFLPLAAL